MILEPPFGEPSPSEPPDGWAELRHLLASVYWRGVSDERDRWNDFVGTGPDAEFPPIPEEFR